MSLSSLVARGLFWSAYVAAVLAGLVYLFAKGCA